MTRRPATAETPFSEALRAELTRLNITSVDVALELEKSARDEAIPSDRIRKWARGNGRPQREGKVHVLERALIRIATRKKLMPLTSGALLRHWESPHAHAPQSQPAHSSAAKVEASRTKRVSTITEDASHRTDKTLGETCQYLLDVSTNRDDFINPLPRIPVPCNYLTVGGVNHVLPDAADIATRFVENPTPSLLVVLGIAGSGKSELLRRTAAAALGDSDRHAIFIEYVDIATRLLAEDAASAVASYLREVSTQAYEQFLDLKESDPSRLIVVIDAFDEARGTVEAADTVTALRRLIPLVADRMRLVLAARRTLSTGPDNFLIELERQSRAHGDAASCEIVELLPCAYDDIIDALKHLPKQHASMAAYLRSNGHLQTDRLLRPLFLQMLHDLQNDRIRTTEISSTFSLYELYVDATLDSELPRSSSLIPARAKHAILRHVARDLFAAQRPRLDIESVEALVLEEVGRTSNRSWVTRPELDGYDWPGDFFRSNHLLAAGTTDETSATVEFVHHTIFEFFLTKHFVSEFQLNGRFGLDNDIQSLRVFDSLLPFFLRAQFIEGEDADALERLVLSDSASNLDKLLAFFLIEDSPRVQEFLQRLSAAWVPFLAAAERTFDSFFMKKLVRFQLILLDTGIGRALAYVADARQREIDQDQDIEAHTFAARLNPTDFLLNRISNPTLANALPVFVYRLGQFGNAHAIPELQNLSTHREPMLRALVFEAIERIQAREDAL